MGVPGLFAWLRRKYPLIVESCTASTDQEYEYGQVESDCDNLYVDFNHIAHACTHPGWRDTPYQSELECFLEMEQYLDRLFNLVRPQRLMMVAIDGVAPQAKISQQRTRRFMSAYTEDVRRKLEAEVRREMEGEAGGAVHIPALPDFDSNVITPGTAFMARMAQMLRSFFEQKLACDVNWRHVQVILSDANEPGEGEHKIMRFIRQQRTQASYDPNTRHVVYGQDADLNLLGLLTHEPHFSILREAAPLESIVEESGVDTQDTAWSPAAQQPLHYLRVSVLREYLKWEFADLIGLPPQGNPNAYLSEQEPDGAEGEDGGAGGQDQGGKKFEFERMAEDFVLLTFMAGNDFLPNLPSLEIYDRPSALDTLLKTYRDLLPSMGGYLTKGGTINPDRLRRLLTKLAEDEEPAFQRRQLKAAAELRRKMARESEDAGRQAASNGFQGPDATGQWVSLGELAADADLDALLGQAPDEGNVPRIDLTTARPSELRREVLRRVNERLNAKLMGSAAADPVRLALQGYRARHYEIRFGASPGEGVEKMARKVSQAYVQGLAWVIAYYCQGNTPVFTTDAVRQAQRSTAGKARWQKGEDGTAGAAWDWFYPYYYAPLVSDLCRNTGALSKIKWSTGKSGLEDSAGESWADGHGPVRPLVQLMAVLPPQSAAQCLPRKLASLLVATQEVEGSSQLTNASMAAALADMFPRHIEPLIDMAGKKWAHTAVVKLPFADVKRLAGAAQMDAPDEQELTPDEEERNTFRSAVLMMVAEHPEADTAQALAADHNGGGASAGGSSVLSLVVPGSVDAVASDDQSVVSVALDTAGMPAQPFAPSLLPGVEVGRAVVDCRVWAKRRMEAQRRQLAWAGQGGARGSRGGRGGGRQGRGAGRGRRGGYSYGGGGGGGPPTAPTSRSQPQAPARVDPAQPFLAARDGSPIFQLPEYSQPAGQPTRQNTHARASTSQPSSYSAGGQYGAPNGASAGYGAAAYCARPAAQDDAHEQKILTADEEFARALQAQLDAEAGISARPAWASDPATLDDEQLARRLQKQEGTRRASNFRPDRLTALQIQEDTKMARLLQAAETGALYTALPATAVMPGGAWDVANLVDDGFGGVSSSSNAAPASGFGGVSSSAGAPAPANHSASHAPADLWEDDFPGLPSAGKPTYVPPPVPTASRAAPAANAAPTAAAPAGNGHFDSADWDALESPSQASASATPAAASAAPTSSPTGNGGYRSQSSVRQPTVARPPAAVAKPATAAEEDSWDAVVAEQEASLAAFARQREASLAQYMQQRAQQAQQAQQQPAIAAPAPVQHSISAATPRQTPAAAQQGPAALSSAQHAQRSIQEQDWLAGEAGADSDWPMAASTSYADAQQQTPVHSSYATPAPGTAAGSLMPRFGGPNQPASGFDGTARKPATGYSTWDDSHGTPATQQEQDFFRSLAPPAHTSPTAAAQAPRSSAAAVPAAQPAAPDRSFDPVIKPPATPVVAAPQLNYSASPASPLSPTPGASSAIALGAAGLASAMGLPTPPAAATAAVGTKTVPSQPAVPAAPLIPQRPAFRPTYCPPVLRPAYRPPATFTPPASLSAATAPTRVTPAASGAVPTSPGNNRSAAVSTSPPGFPSTAGLALPASTGGNLGSTAVSTSPRGFPYAAGPPRVPAAAPRPAAPYRPPGF